MFVVKLNISIIFYLRYISAPSAFAEAPRQGLVQLALHLAQRGAAGKLPDDYSDVCHCCLYVCHNPVILINITKVHCQTVSNRSDFSPTMLALVKDGVVHFIPLQAVHFKLIRTVQIILIYPVHLKVIWAVHLNRYNQRISMCLRS